MQSACEQLAVVSRINPATVTSAGANGDTVDMAKYGQVAFFFALGDVAAETVDALVQQCTAADGTGAATLKAATQLAAHASNNDNKQIVIEVKASDLGAAYRWVRPRLVTGGATGGPAVCVGVAYTSRNEPASDGDLSSVVEIKR